MRRPSGQYLFLAIPPLFYFWTTAPGIGYAEQAIIIDWMLRGTPGTGASHHSLTFLAGHVFSQLLPFQEIAYRCNLVSAVFGALAIALFYSTALRVTGRTWLAVATACLLMTSHSMWWLSTIAEVHALNALFCTLILYCLVRFELEGRQVWLRGAAYAAGLALFNHLQLGVWLPAILLVGWLSTEGSWVTRLRSSVRTGLCWLAGFAPFLALFVWEAAQAGLSATGADAGGGEFSRSFFRFFTWQAFVNQTTSAARLFMLQWGWPSPYWLFIAAGAALALRGSRLRLTNTAVLVAFVFNTAFFSFYAVWDKFTFLLPSFILLSYLGALGLGWSWQTHIASRPALRLPAAVLVSATCLFPMAFFRMLPELAEGSDFWAAYRSDPSTRLWIFDGAYLANPNKRGETSVGDYVGAVLERAPANALLVDHGSRTFFQIEHYRQLYGRRADLRVVQFVPPGWDTPRWRAGYTAEPLADLIARRVSSEQSVILTTTVGFDLVVRALLDRKITLLEFPLNATDSVHLARGARDVDWGPWLDRVGSSGPSVIVHLAGRNPPTLLQIVWRSASGQRVSRGPFPIPFDAPPLRFESPHRVVAEDGDWSGTVYLFDQPVASFEVD